MKKTVIGHKANCAHITKTSAYFTESVYTNRDFPGRNISPQSSPNIEKHLMTFEEGGDRNVQRDRHPYNSKPRRRFRIGKKGERHLRGTITRKSMLRQKELLRRTHDDTENMSVIDAIYEELMFGEVILTKEELFAQNVTAKTDFPTKPKKKKSDMTDIIIRYKRHIQKAA